MMKWLIVCCIALSLITVPAAAQTAPATTCNPAKSAVKAGSEWQKMTSDGVERTYLRHIPPGYDPAQTAPLILSLHGFTSNGDQQARLSDWNTIADVEHFVVVYPQATGRPSRWYAGRADFIGQNADKIDDVQFIRDLIGTLEQDLCIDSTRIYVTGMSNGGGMTNRLACELADKIAAVGMVAGAYTTLPDGCNPTRPIPVIAFHGTADPLVNYKGDKRSGFPPIQTWAADWADRNGCDSKPDIIPATGDASGLHYQHCKANADVILYTIDGGGHTWPGSPLGKLRLLGKTSTDINASAVMWDFFKAHPLPT